jgi:hypothetical protein
MWLKALAVVVVAGIATVSGLALASGDQSSGSPARPGSPPRQGSAAPLTISPASGNSRTAFTFTFEAPATTGREGQTSLGYTLAVTGLPRTRHGCLSARTQEAGPATQGATVTITLDPARLAATWCPGTYTARVTEIQTPVCSSQEMCPQYIRVVGTVATGRFRVAGP